MTIGASEVVSDFYDDSKVPRIRAITPHVKWGNRDRRPIYGLNMMKQ